MGSSASRSTVADGYGRGGPTISRRRLLGGGAAALVLAACGGDDRAAGPGGGAAAAPTASTTTPIRPPERLGPEDFTGLGVCSLLPEQMAGPFPLDEQLVRRDITEGVPGEPMRLGLRVVDPACEPVAGAAVEVWHCDASGDYSAFLDGGGGKDEGPGTTFLRGTQVSGADGIVEFLTIVPGWYPGRAVHVHLRVRQGDDLVLTSQLYFDPAHLARVRRRAPYRAFGAPDTSNTSDAIAGSPRRDGTLLHTRTVGTSAEPGTLALLNVGVGAPTLA
jgi:protocatechuate 3,4-dioxygenase beta subunit